MAKRVDRVFGAGYGYIGSIRRCERFDYVGLDISFSDWALSNHEALLMAYRIGTSSLKSSCFSSVGAPVLVILITSSLAAQTQSTQPASRNSAPDDSVATMWDLADLRHGDR